MNRLETKKPGKGNNNTFFIGLLSFFGGISQDIFVPVIPLYLSNVLHMDKSFIGLTDGIVTASASIFKVVAGWASDKTKKRKPFVFLGYFLSMVARPLLAIISSGFGILFLRFIDGVGKGVKDSPKDALIADSSDQVSRGKSFGIVRALDTLGSVAGPIFLFFLLYLLRNNALKYHYIFLISAIPLFITIYIIRYFVKEKNNDEGKIDLKLDFNLSKKFYYFLFITIVFSIGNSSSIFLILRAENVGVSLLAIPLVFALFNFIYAAASIPTGILSDRIGREKVILLGWAAFALSYLGFARANSPIEIWLYFSLYGVFFATTEGVTKALVADIVPQNHRGKAYGIYNTALGLTTLPSSLVAGILWDKFGPSTPFYFGTAVAALSAVLLVLFIRNYYPSKLEFKK